MRLILGNRHCSGCRDSGPVALVGEDPREGSIDCGSEGRTAADIDYGSEGQGAVDIDVDSEGRKAVGIGFGSEGREAAGIGFAEADREAADNAPGWAVGRWEEGTGPAVALMGADSPGFEPGRDYWNFGEGIVLGNLQDSGIRQGADLEAGSMTAHIQSGTGAWSRVVGRIRQEMERKGPRHNR